ncbi:hypothetical protein VB713_09080 [Anabaena cylindrica UHCC 0172]|uniref:hypothetical protein n=1 Tax=Anabaena cylindrica TaxID=1165 RepID=UPI002B1FF267|nr:hypothetical protein [Anabaena cylindrica]MEA5551124.1 hypothetical protein [Anabaena cylindrica UHCC 0172]
MKLIKKSEKLLLDKIKNMEEEEQNLQKESLYSPEELIDERAFTSEANQEPQYIPLRDNPVVYSIGNTGWQVSEIWKDVRLDDFCGG